MDNETALREVSKDDLKLILTGHARWLDSGKTEGQPANLEGYNLRGAVLLGANLKGANLKGAYLYGAYLKNANLEQANLAGANLRGANLRWANLKNADLSEANLVRADLKAWRRVQRLPYSSGWKLHLLQRLLHSRSGRCNRHIWDCFCAHNFPNPLYLSIL